MTRAIHYRLMFMFLISGAAALVYQVCWQRLLFESVGVDIDSTTIIVSTFMLGLGVGSLVGGRLADRFPEQTLELFASMELLTAAFGVASPYLIHATSEAIVEATLPTVVSVNFALLLIPTTLMGATLPILVRRVLRMYENMGESVGALYFSNTLGGALGAGFTGFVALYWMGLNSTIRMAAGLNLAAAVVALVTMRVRRA